jgi:hypothetical protein
MLQGEWKGEGATCTCISYELPLSTDQASDTANCTYDALHFISQHLEA